MWSDAPESIFHDSTVADSVVRADEKLPFWAIEQEGVGLGWVLCCWNCACMKNCCSSAICSMVKTECPCSLLSSTMAWYPHPSPCFLGCQFVGFPCNSQQFSRLWLDRWQWSHHTRLFCRPPRWSGVKRCSPEFGHCSPEFGRYSLEAELLRLVTSAEFCRKDSDGSLEVLSITRLLLSSRLTSVISWIPGKGFVPKLRP